MTFNLGYFLTFLSIAGTGGSWAYLAANSGERAPANFLSFDSVFEMEKFENGPCLDLLFQDQDFSKILPTTLSQTSNNGAKEELKITTLNPNNPKNGEGCVAVKWNRQTWKNGWWKGKIRFEWALKSGENAIIARGFSSNSDALGNPRKPKDIHLDWRIIWMKNKKVEKFMAARTTMLNDKMAEKLLPQSFVQNDYWKFNLNTENVCRLSDNSNCSGNPENSSELFGKWRWKQEESGKEKFSDWSKNFSNVWNSFRLLKFYQFEVKNLFDINGKWEKF